MSYERVNWENYPSENTPINAENLNKMDEYLAKCIEFDSLSHQPTTNTKGNANTLYSYMYMGEDHKPHRDYYLCDGAISGGRYEWIKLATITEFAEGLNNLKDILKVKVDGAYAEDGYLYLTSNDEVVAGPLGPFTGDIDMSNFVPKTRTIAGLALSSNIKKDELLNALRNMLHGSHAPTTSTVGIAGQLYYQENTNPAKLYVCVGNNSNEYKWVDITSGGSGAVEVDLSSYVPNTRKVAGLSLDENIDKEDLKYALRTYKTGVGAPTVDTVSNLADIYIDTNTLDVYMYCGFSNGSAVWKKLNNENIDSVVADEILDFSQTAMPKTFSFEDGLINSNGENLNSTEYCRSDFIAVDEAFRYKLFAKNVTDSSQSIFTYLYDENKEYIASSRRTMVLESNTQQTYVLTTANCKYIRICTTSAMKDAFIRLYYDEQVSFSTKEDLKKATFGLPKNLLSYSDCFAQNKKVVFIGDSITQGLGSTGIVSYTDSNNVSVYGNGNEYGVKHSLPSYEIGKKLYQSGNKCWYEAIDGSGYAHRLKNYLQNKFGCEVKNYGMSGITTGTLIGQTMNADNSGLVSQSDGTVRVFEGLTSGFDTVVIMIGTNDRGFRNISDFTYNLNWIVNNLLDVKHKKVILMSATPTLTETQNLSMAQIDEAIRGIAETHNIPFVSVYNRMTEYCTSTNTQLNTLLKADGIHPNDTGYDIINSIICDELGISDVDKSYVDRAISQISAYTLTDEDKQDIAQLVYNMMSNS